MTNDLKIKKACAKPHWKQ